MSEPDLEKGKKKRRRRSARVYLSNAHPLPTPEQLAALVDQFPSDEDDDGQAAAVARPDRVKRDVGQAEREQLARQGRAVVNADGHVSYPVASHSDAENALALIRSGHGDTAAAKRMLRRVAREEGWSDILAELGGKKSGGASKAIAAAGSFTFPGGRNPADRTSASLTEGHQAVSSGHHVDPNVPGPSELAFRHPSMRMGTNTPFPLATMGTDDTAFPRDLRGMSNGVPVALSRLDAAAASGMPGPPANPFSRPGDHIAQNSAMPPNGSHSLSDPRSHAAPMAAKSNTERLAEFKRHMFGGSGGSR